MEGLGVSASMQPPECFEGFSFNRCAAELRVFIYLLQGWSRDCAEPCVLRFCLFSCVGNDSIGTEFEFPHFVALIIQFRDQAERLFRMSVQPQHVDVLQNYLFNSVVQALVS